MDKTECSVVICEIADECFNDIDDEDQQLTFIHAKKRWKLRGCFSQNATALVRIMGEFRNGRSKKFCLQALPAEEPDKLMLVLLQKEFAIGYAASARDMEFAAELLPLIFSNYTASLEFEVERAQCQQKRELKSYVTTHLYNSLYEKHQSLLNNEPNSLNLQNNFTSKLRKYQEHTVNWMLMREKESNDFPAECTLLTTLDGKHKVIKNNYSLHFYAYEDTIPSIKLPPGGILADEMGLGKTVELLATVLLNPRWFIDRSTWYKILDNLPDEVPHKKRRTTYKLMCICMKDDKSLEEIQCQRCQLWQHSICMRACDKPTDDYICPMCWTEQPSSLLLETGATIIVSPNPIMLQWLDEIKKHINPSPKVMLYSGLSRYWTSPRELANCDIVLTDYNILTQELNHALPNQERELRHEQRYMRPKSPLLMLNWWRVCLDEAQMVESSTSKAAEMVRQLHGVNRWAVTGTPIQHTIDDLAPLLQFVGFSEACQPRDTWQTVANSFLLNHKPEPLVQMLQHVMWRTCKSNVEHELGIPPQTEQVHQLELSNVESLYYREEHDKCTHLFIAAVAKHMKYSSSNSSNSLASISPQLVKKILQPFLRIRKSCSIPVVLNKNVSTVTYLNPQELLAHLTSNNEQQCKTELRSWASSLNGIASVDFIRKNYADAIFNYKLVLKLAADYNTPNITVDSVLQIHALHNMLEASRWAPVDEELTDDEVSTYRQKLQSLERKYLQEIVNIMEQVYKDYSQNIKKLKKLEQDFSGSILDLFSTLVSTSTNIHTAMWNKITDEFFKHNISSEKLQNANSMSGVLYLVSNWHKRLRKLNKILRTDIKKLKSRITEALDTLKRGSPLLEDFNFFVKNVSLCHLSDILNDKPPDPEELPKVRFCPLCKLQEVLNQVECLLFAKQLNKDNPITDGLDMPSDEILIIKTVFGFLRTRSEFSEWKAECQSKLEWLGTMQTLIKLQFKYWIEAEYVIKAFDELDMCKMRIRLTHNPDEQSNYCLLPHQLDEQLEFNENNIKEAQVNFVRLSGRLKYLNHLSEDTSDKPCPICHTLDDERYVMLSCGHFLCQLCLDGMRKGKYESQTICPLCRQTSPQLYYSIRRGLNNSIVVGNYSTKIAYIVELVLKLKAEDENVKILIFSQWQFILDRVAKALLENNVKICSNIRNKKVDYFKSAESGQTCLLMPMSRGSKGLNLIEATHVFLVEPILTPGDELQAIGRVHRFGQTKATTVHRFIVNGTIEENILKLIKSADDKSTFATHWDLDNMTFDSLKELFILKEKDEEST
ncbi:E3 ubiquitin-protein ligase SHPRH [Drosophila busckii]|uniref:E3 ubiquitin-protein ligase SHPRH n=1 Tax=Drosophila busckii TaxID=30019 RepID=UPI001432A64F|nr:E3 ubiquitin-protein ligase SHPRH [Drosophila busckii]